jgi:hypothetical protein
MANNFETRTELARRAGLMIQDEFMIGQLTNRSMENQFSPGAGNSIKISIPTASTGELWNKSGSIGASQELTETEHTLTISYACVDKKILTQAQRKYDIEEMTEQVIRPMVAGVINQAETYTKNLIARGFGRYLTGTAGTEISTHAHILEGVKEYHTNAKMQADKVMLMTLPSYYALRGLNIFNSLEYGQDRPLSLADGLIGRAERTNYFGSPFCGTFSQGNIAGTVLVDGGSQTGTTLHIDGLTAATGTIYAGTRFTLNGVVYTIIEDATIANYECDVILNKDFGTPSSEDAITFQTAYKENILYNPEAVAAAFLPAAPDDSNTSTFFVNGFGISLTESDTSTSNLSKELVLAMDIAVRVIQPKMGCIVQG